MKLFRGRTVLCALAFVACEAAPPPPPPPPSAVGPGSNDVPQYTLEVVRRLPHDPGAFTQGLLLQDGVLYESTGRYGESEVRKVDPATGKVLERVALPRNVFGEGLALTGEDLVQLTWKEFLAYFYDPRTLALKRTVNFGGSGWGLCFDGEHLLMTTGADRLVVRDPRTFDVVSEVPITRGGQPLFFVNELECVGDTIWGNVYPTTRIVRIDKGSGRVIGEVDAGSLVPAGVDPADPDQALNGIAYDPQAGTFYLTGKRWPAMFEVKITAQVRSEHQ